MEQEVEKIPLMVDLVSEEEVSTQPENVFYEDRRGVVIASSPRSVEGNKELPQQADAEQNCDRSSSPAPPNLLEEKVSDEKECYSPSATPPELMYVPIHHLDQDLTQVVTETVPQTTTDADKDQLQFHDFFPPTGRPGNYFINSDV